MVRCSVLGCNSRRSQHRNTITFHRLPKAEEKQNQWLKNIGVENLKLDPKPILICSLHFEEPCFNKTLNIIKLQDDALPTRFLGKPHQNHRTSWKPVKLEPQELELFSNLDDDENEISTSPVQSDAPDLSEQEEDGQSDADNNQILLKQKKLYRTQTELIKKTKELDKRNKRCTEHLKLIKRLYEKIRRQSMLIADYRKIIEELRVNVLED